MKEVMRLSKNLIVYFSRSGENYVNGKIVNLEIGNTEIAAQMIHSLISSDIFQIQTIHEYPSDYHQCTKEAKWEKEHHQRPKIIDYVHQFSSYDNIFVCYPNWWSTMPMALFTFFECHDTKQKNIIPLCTHEGSGMGESILDLKLLCPRAHVFHGLSIIGSQVKDSKDLIVHYLAQLSQEIQL